mgnify:CR=1 FL=1
MTAEEVEEVQDLVADMSRDLRALQAQVETVLLLPKSHAVSGVLLQAKKEFQEALKTKKKSGPFLHERHYTGPVLVLVALLQSMRPEVAALYPELGMSKEQREQVIQLLRKDKAMCDRIIPFVITKLTKKEDRVLVRVVGGRGRLGPPLVPRVLNIASLVEVLEQGFHEFVDRGSGPPLGKERAVQARLKGKKKKNKNKAEQSQKEQETQPAKAQAKAKAKAKSS